MSKTLKPSSLVICYYGIFDLSAAITLQHHIISASIYSLLRGSAVPALAIAPVLFAFPDLSQEKRP